jgi:hypothetical protein
MTRTIAEIQKLFLSSPRYAVVGASKDQSKFGTKVRVIVQSSTWLGQLLKQADITGIAMVFGT